MHSLESTKKTCRTKLAQNQNITEHCCSKTKSLTPEISRHSSITKMDNVVKGMEWKDVVSTHEDVIQGQMRDTSNPPPPPPIHAGPDTHPQPGDSQTRGFGGCNLVGEGSSVFQQQASLLNTLSTTEPAHLYSQEGTGSQVQDCNIPVIPEDMVQYLHPVGYLNDMMACDFAPAAPPLFNSCSIKRKHPDQQDADQPYIKKPPNAFMLFLKEQRPKVASELNVTKSAAVNAIVGQRWKSLSKDQQAKYYQQADKERQLHAQQHPDWSTKDNYGKMRKRVRRRTLAAVSKPEEVTPQLLSLPALPQHLSSPHTDLFTGPQAHQVSPACDVDPPASTLWDVTADEIFSGDIITEEKLFSLLDQYEALPHAAEPQ